MPSETNREVAERICPHSMFHMGAASTRDMRARLIDAIAVALDAERERCAKILETRADELQAEWALPPCAENFFTEMTADTPAGYATYWGMNHLRKLAREIRGSKD